VNNLKENGLSMYFQFSPGSHHLTNEMNGDQCLQQSQASSMSSHSGDSAITNLESFSKLLSTIKKLANQQIIMENLEFVHHVKKIVWYTSECSRSISP
jgi:hypothetical protein